MARKAKSSRYRAPKNEKGTMTSPPAEEEINDADDVITFNLNFPGGLGTILTMNLAVFKEQGTLAILFLTINDLPETWYLGTLLAKYKGRALKDTDKFDDVGFKKINTLDITDNEPNFTGVTLRHHLNRVMTLLSTDYNRASATHCRSALSEIDSDKDSAAEKDVDYVKELTDSSQVTTKAYDLTSWGLRGFKELSYSSFNPPLPRDYNAGHLAYLHLITLEGAHHSITCSTKGFYINKIKGDHFDPEIHPKHPKIYSNLINLMSDLSPAFPPIFQKAHANAKIVVANIPMYGPQTWYSLDLPNKRCAMRSEFLGYMSGFFQYDENFLANFEFSAAVASNHLTGSPGTEDVLSGSMSVFFHDNLQRTTRRVFDGDVTYNFLENDEEEYSFGSFRVRTINTDNEWAIALNQRKMANFLYHCATIPNEKVYPVVMGVVKYRGKRAVGLSLPPNSMQGIYNSTTVGAMRDQFYVDDPYVARLFGDQINKPDLFLPNTVNVVGGKTAEIFGHYTNRIITVSDKIAYVFPGHFSTLPDPNYRENGKVTPLMRSLGFPKKLRHDFAEFRHTALHRLTEFRAFALYKIQKVITSQDPNTVTLDTFPELADACLNEVILGRTNKKFLPVLQKVRENLFGDAEIQEEKCIRELLNNRVVMRSLLTGLREGSHVKVIEAFKSFVPKNSTLPYYDVRFNPNAYESKDFLVPSTDKNEKMNIAVLGEFNVTIQIPSFLYLQFVDESTILDNAQLLELWKKRLGINTRYLGLLVKGVEGIEVFSELKKLAISEILLRSAKHVFNTLIEPTDRSQTSKAVSHFLNCIFGLVSKVEAARSGKNTSSHRDTIFTLTSASLFELIANDMREHFGFDVKAESFAELFSGYGITKLPVLRRLCLLTGIVLSLKDYDLASEAPVSLGDVVDVVPIVKGYDFESVTTNENYTCALEETTQHNYFDARVIADLTYKQMESIMGPNLADVGFWLQYCNKMSFRVVTVPPFQHQLTAASIIERALGPCNFKTVHAYLFTAAVAAFHEFYNTALKLCLRVHRMTRLISGVNDSFVAHVELTLGLLLTITKHPDAIGVLDLCLARRNGSIRNFDTNIVPSIAAAYCYHREFRKVIALYKEVLATGDLYLDDRKYFEKQLEFAVNDAVNHQRSINNNNEVLALKDMASVADAGNPLKSLGTILFRIINSVIPDPFVPFTVNIVSDYYKNIHGNVDKERIRKKIHRKIRSFD
uniref:Capsid protein n=1 Tax=Panagrellus redivivus TaxID=6233 RepID=A0A7E4ZV61_PANRE